MKAQLLAQRGACNQHSCDCAGRAKWTGALSMKIDLPDVFEGRATAVLSRNRLAFCATLA
jgi:hypothetical protein